MKITASTLRTLADQPPRSIPAVLRILADQLEAEETRLASQRERTRKHRERNVTVTSLVTSEKRDCEVTTPSPKKEIPPTPPKEKTPLSRITTADAREVSKSEEQELLDAAGKSLGASPNIFVMAVPLRWKQSGMDWELDVLPAVRVAAKAKRDGSINGWEYFTRPIADWHETRTKPMPEGINGNARQPKRTTADFARELSNQLRERERNDANPVEAVVLLPGEGERRRQQA